jgi:type 1 glutamine amidotransferase
MMAEGVGFTAIHWGTGANKQNGPDYLKILGGWFHPGSGIKFAKAKLVQIDPKHPICRGWSDWDWHDEYYLNLDFDPKTKPLVKVSLDGKEQVVAWVLERPDSKRGRSFGTTLGHSHENFTNESFRRLLVNGILWTARVRIPRTGAPCALSDQDLALPSVEKPK